LELAAVEARLAGAVALVAAAFLGRPVAGLAGRRARLAVARDLAVAWAIVAAVVVAMARTLMIEARLPP
ncbi:hypothetical protein, partial [Klebsiella aerogenes]|uniref:hypothetical protein n=1 Tax=Klebsiella aerogenes TaxID=548 RepID=UPI0019544F51